MRDTATVPPRPWLLELATPQRGSVDPMPGTYYDDAEQMTFLHEPPVALIDSSHKTMTKKADREAGEDEKR